MNRQIGVVVEKPFVYGSAATLRGEEQNDENTHKWTIYLRGQKNDDMSTFIKKVHFHLHESFKDPVRIITNAPYEVTEFGWGEFITNIEVYFHDEANEEPVIIHHLLKQFPENRNTPLPKNSPLISEHYDEFVFVSPTSAFHAMLLQPPRKFFDNHFLINYFTNEQIYEMQQKHLNKIAEAQVVVKRHINKLRATIYMTEVQIQQQLNS